MLRTLPLNDGHTIPQLGYGVHRIPPEDTQAAVEAAFEVGYRHIDTATIYRNEAGVGAAVRASGIDRNELFITTKLWNTDQGYDTALEACERSLELLGLDYLDLYLIHWAQPGLGKYRQSWDALLELRERGLVRSVGVSNFTEQQLEDLTDSGVAPAVHQLELHPTFNQAQMRRANSDRGIITEPWAPLGVGDDLKDQTIIDIAEAHGVDAGAVVIAWHLAHGMVPLPKTVTPARLTSNFAAQELQLSPDEVVAIDALTRDDGRRGPDPAEGDLGAPVYSDRRSYRG